MRHVAHVVKKAFARVFSHGPPLARSPKTLPPPSGLHQECYRASSS
jgi:hypothetical protein